MLLVLCAGCGSPAMHNGGCNQTGSNCPAQVTNYSGNWVGTITVTSMLGSTPITVWSVALHDDASGRWRPAEVRRQLHRAGQCRVVRGCVATEEHNISNSYSSSRDRVEGEVEHAGSDGAIYGGRDLWVDAWRRNRESAGSMYYAAVFQCGPSSLDVNGTPATFTAKKQ